MCLSSVVQPLGAVKFAAPSVCVLDESFFSVSLNVQVRPVVLEPQELPPATRT